MPVRPHSWWRCAARGKGLASGQRHLRRRASIPGRGGFGRLGRGRFDRGRFEVECEEVAWSVLLRGGVPDDFDPRHGNVTEAVEVAEYERVRWKRRITCTVLRQIVGREGLAVTVYYLWACLPSAGSRRA
jgi:hypothetical protein